MMTEFREWLQRRRLRRKATIYDLQQLEDKIMSEVQELVTQIRANLDRLDNAGKGVRIDVDKLKADIEILKGQTLDAEGLQALRDVEVQTASLAAVFEGIDAETPGEVVEPPPVDPEEPAESSKVAPPIERDRSVKDWS